MNIPTKISSLQCRDTALALIFLALLIWFFSHDALFGYAAMGIALFAMIWPRGMLWPAKLWFGLAHILGSFMSRVLLSAIYMVLLLPVALLRRCLGKDVMALRTWKKEGSAFVTRDHTFSAEDLKQPY